MPEALPLICFQDLSTSVNCRTRGPRHPQCFEHVPGHVVPHPKDSGHFWTDHAVNLNLQKSETKPWLHGQLVDTRGSCYINDINLSRAQKRGPRNVDSKSYLPGATNCHKIPQTFKDSKAIPKKRPP